ncbi:MAG: hypothetical protein KGH69_00695 [Candidatus Micrarchaeota archaeon]|nr:hypothetical protein [Candidatus Micrarchaeota archaeon]
MPDRKTIGLDLDDVLSDSMGVWLRMAEETLGIKSHKGAITRYHLTEIFSSLTTMQVREMFRALWSDYRRMPMLDPGIPGIVGKLKGSYDIAITTATSANLKDATAWMEQNGIAYDRLVLFNTASEKHLAEGVDIYIDDHPDVAENVASVGKRSILFRQPWNEELIARNSDPNITVVDSWGQIERLLLPE